MGGCCHGARQSCRQGPRLRPAGPLLSQGPTPPSAWHAWTWARKPLQGSFANGLESRDELAKTGSKLVGKAGGGSLLPCSRARAGAGRKWLSGEAICCPALSGGKGTRLALEAINTEQLVDDFIVG